MASEPADTDNEDVAAGESRFESRVHAHGNKKPFQRKGAYQRANLIFRRPSRTYVGISTSVPKDRLLWLRRAGPSATLDKAMFFLLPARELTRNVRLCQCAVFQSAASDAAQARGIRCASARAVAATGRARARARHGGQQQVRMAYQLESRLKVARRP